MLVEVYGRGTINCYAKILLFFKIFQRANYSLYTIEPCTLYNKERYYQVPKRTVKILVLHIKLYGIIRVSSLTKTMSVSMIQQSDSKVSALNRKIDAVS